MVNALVKDVCARKSLHCHWQQTEVLCISVAEPVDCLLSSSRVLAIATSFGLSIFVLVYVAAAFSGKLHTLHAPIWFWPAYLQLYCF